MKEYISNSAEDTAKIARDLLGTLKGGDILALSGNLGAGKTVFTKSIAKELGVKENVNSPTFVLMKIYKTENKTIKNLVHVDCYRLEEGENLEDIGLSDYLQDKNTLVVIEWADKVVDFPKSTIKIKIEYLNDSQRKIIIEN